MKKYLLKLKSTSFDFSDQKLASNKSVFKLNIPTRNL
jgi:hypothetical protein